MRHYKYFGYMEPEALEDIIVAHVESHGCLPEGVRKLLEEGSTE